MLTDLLADFLPITLTEMDAVTLMNRIDTKYVTTVPVLEELLRQAAQRGYRVLETESTRLCPYDSIYFDTPGLRMFTDHRNRKLVRQKVRTRVYLTSGATFLEVKRKNNHGRTRKKRTPIPGEAFRDFREFPDAASYLAVKSDFTAAQISPALETRFDRITLVNAAKTERLTIDTALHFRNQRNGAEADIPGGVIIELKQDGRVVSEMKEILRALRVKELRVSKYCIGTALTDPTCRPGRFKLKLRRIQKVIST
ncbi:MAG: polyphosphate polymerase domain-containing protein [Bacteroidales bacterium]|nr:polyphosphate polymerase domain-containing protein [Bacteroidales bacterium]